VIRFDDEFLQRTSSFDFLIATYDFTLKYNFELISEIEDFH
jgi:hypothetical protein